MAKIPHLINTFIKIGQNVLSHRAFDGLIADYVIEYGTNSRGDWEKYKSGKMIQSGSIRVDMTANTVTSTIVYLPQTFVDNSYKVTSLMIESSAPGAFPHPPTYSGKGGNGFFIRIIRSTTDWNMVDWEAKGRWK